MPERDDAFPWHNKLVTILLFTKVFTFLTTCCENVLKATIKVKIINIITWLCKKNQHDLRLQNLTYSEPKSNSC